MQSVVPSTPCRDALRYSGVKQDCREEIVSKLDAQPVPLWDSLCPRYEARGSTCERVAVIEDDHQRIIP